MTPGHAGRFVLEKPLRAGAAGRTFAGRDPVSGARVVATFVDAGAERADALAALGPLLERGRGDGDVPFLVRAWIDGETLAERLRRGPLAAGEAEALGRRLAGALDAAHQAGVAHGALEPAAIVLPGGRLEDAVLVDFGLAVARPRDDLAALARLLAAAKVDALRSTVLTPDYPGSGRTQTTAAPDEGDVPRRRDDDTVAERYVLLGELGRGGMGVVHAAQDLELGRKVALKLVHPQQATASGQARLMREAQALAQLKHPNVVTVYDLGSFGDAIFVAMELIEGPSLGAWLEQKKRGWREIVPAFVAAARGLHAAHAVGLVHRDFKPDNVLIDADGSVRVVDFGLARLAPVQSGESAPSGEHLNAAITRAGAIAGTPAYMSPEVLRGQVADAASDQFSFGVALAEALSGRLPFLGVDRAERLAAMERGVVFDARAVPARLRAIVNRTLRVDPRARFPSMAALVEALGRVLEPPRGRRLALAAAAVVVLGAGGFTWWQSSRRAAACAVEASAIQDVWSPRRHDAARRAFLATSVPYAARAFDEASARLGDYLRSWADWSQATCRAGEQTASVRACLDERLQALLALSDLLGRADAAVVKNAVRAVRTLGRPEACTDARARPPLPTDPVVAQRVMEVRQTGARALALEAAGKPRAAYLLRAVAALAARAIAFPALEAEAIQNLATSQDDFGDTEAAERGWFEAYSRAVTAGQDYDSAMLASRVALSLKDKPDRRTEAERWASLAETHMARDGRDRTIFMIEANLATFYDRDLDQAVAHAERSRAALGRLRETEAAGAAVAAYTNLARLMARKGDYAAARRYEDHAYALQVTIMGRDHPNLSVLLTNQGSTLMNLHRYAEALGLFRGALDNALANFGENHPRTYIIMANLGLAEQRLGLLDSAEARVAAARTGLHAKVGGYNPWVVIIDRMWARILIERHRLPEARELLEQVLAAEEKRGDPPDELIVTIVMLAEVAVGQERRPDALALVARALDVGRDLNPDTDELVKARELRAKLQP